MGLDDLTPEDGGDMVDNPFIQANKQMELQDKQQKQQMKLQQQQGAQQADQQGRDQEDDNQFASRVAQKQVANKPTAQAKQKATA